MRNFILLLSIACFISACKVELAENETAELSLAWTCLYRAGQGMSCPGKAVTKVKGKVKEMTHRQLGTTDSEVANVVVNHIVNRAENIIIPGGIQTAIFCLEIGGDGICKLVEIANRDKITAPEIMTRKSVTRPKILKARNATLAKGRAGRPKDTLIDGKYTITINRVVKNVGGSSSSEPSTTTSSSASSTPAQYSYSSYSSSANIDS